MQMYPNNNVPTGQGPQSGETPLVNMPTINHPDDSSGHKKGLWFSISLLIIVVVLGGVFLLGSSTKTPRGLETTIIDGVSGIQGIVTSIDSESFILNQTKLIEKDDGNFEIDEKLYTVIWDASTTFKTFYSTDDFINKHFSIIDHNELAIHKNVVIVPSKMDKTSLTLWAEEVFILPGSALIELVDSPPAEGLETTE